MIDLRLGRSALGLGVVVAMLAGCGGAGNGAVPTGGTPDHLSNHKTFNYTGAAQDFTVPAGVRNLDIVARGAHGGGSPKANGGRVHVVIPVTPGEKLVIYVGGDAADAIGGFNGGADGGVACSGSSCYDFSGFGGGGASDLRQGGAALSDRVLVAGGAGGQGASNGYSSSGCDGSSDGAGGKGGGKVGQKGALGCQNGGGGGTGGTQTSGGSGGSGFYGNGGAGTEGSGGGGNSGGEYGGGGGAGGGYYGGGGGGSGGLWCSSDSCGLAGGGGGGGGSSYAERKASDVHMWQGWKNPDPNGLVVISWQ